MSQFVDGLPRHDDRLWPISEVTAHVVEVRQ